MSDAGEKTQAPTAMRRRDAANKGDLLQSRELATSLVFLSGAAWIATAGPWFVGSAESVLRSGLTFGRTDIARFDPALRAWQLCAPAVTPMATLLAATLLATLAAPALLGSLGFRSAAFLPQFNKLNPASGLARIFGTRSLIELGKSLAKVALLGVIGFVVLSSHAQTIRGLSALAPPRAIATAGVIFAGLVLWLGAGLAIIGIIDTPIQFVQRLNRLRMTRDEIKQEHKESEGSPETKTMARQRRHEILNGSARRAIGEATIVLTNPTHFAIAVRYRPGLDAIPLVVARGRGETAQAIKALAKESKIPSLEYPQLTRALYFTTRAGQPISADLYMAVATVLAFVFNLEQAMAESIPPPVIVVPPEKRFDENGHHKP